jgi:hypothetical protein
MTNHKIEVLRLPSGENTKWGAFYAQVDGRNVGDPDRPFWKTRKQPQACGERFVAHVYGDER